MTEIIHCGSQSRVIILIWLALRPVKMHQDCVQSQCLPSSSLGGDAAMSVKIVFKSYSIILRKQKWEFTDPRLGFNTVWQGLFFLTYQIKPNFTERNILMILGGHNLKQEDLQKTCLRTSSYRKVEPSFTVLFSTTMRVHLTT